MAEIEAEELKAVWIGVAICVEIERGLSVIIYLEPLGGCSSERAKVSSLIPGPESHDEDGRDSIETVGAERGEQSNSTLAVISCWNGP